MKLLAEFAGAAIGAAILWLSIPLFIIAFSAIGAVLEGYGILVFLCLPLYVVLSLCYQEYTERKAGN